MNNQLIIQRANSIFNNILYIMLINSQRNLLNNIVWSTNFSKSIFT